MLIRSPGGELFVVRSVRTSPDMDIFVCRNQARVDGRLFTLLIYKEPAKIYDAIASFMQIKRRGITPDFVDCFSMDSRFYVVFRYHEENLLARQLAQGDLMLRERLEAANGILTQILMQDIPPGLLQECLSESNLSFHISLQISFGYFLNNAENYRMVEQEHNMIRVADLLTDLLGRDAKLEAEGANIESMLRKLREGGYTTWAAAYADFKAWYDVVRTFVESEEIRIETKIARFWRVVGRVIGIAKPILAIALVALSIAYMVYTLVNPPTIKGAVKGEIAIVGDVLLPTPIPSDGEENDLLVPWELSEP